MAIDVHQHLWPDELVDRLRARTRPPYLRGWTLHTDGEPPYEVDPHAHDPHARVAVDHEDGVATACVSLSAPLGIEALPRRDAAPLIAACHRGVSALPDHFRAWASVPATDPDLEGLRGLLGDRRFVGLQLPATQLLTPGAWERLGAGAGRGRGAPTYRCWSTRARSRGSPASAPVPGWFPAVVGYTAQLSAAWWALARGRRACAVPAAAPRLRGGRGARTRCTTSGTSSRGGEDRPVDPRRLRRHLRLRAARARRGGAGPRHRRPRAGLRPPVRRAARRAVR